MKIVPEIYDRVYKHGKFVMVITTQEEANWYAKFLTRHAVYFLDLLWHHECDNAEVRGWNLIGS